MINVASFKGSRRPICPACSLRSTSAVQRSSALRPDLPSTHAVPLFKIACSSESAMRVRIVLYWKVTRGNKVYRNIKATIPPYSAASSSSAVAPFENFRPRCAARCFLTQLRRPSVREEAPSLSSHRTRPSFATHPDSFKKGREYALQRRENEDQFECFTNPIPCRLPTVCPTSWRSFKWASSSLPCCFLLSVPLNSRAAEWATAGKKERKPFASLASLPSVQYYPRDGRRT